MAKAKKAKNEEQQQQQQQQQHQQQQKGDNSEAVVRHQKLCLSIDMDKRHIYGFTELEMLVPDNGIVGLHADNLVIESVNVDGEPAEFEVFPHYLHLDNGDRWCSVSTATSAADAAGSVYLSSLERELVPNLLIMCSKSVKAESEQQSHVHTDNGEQLRAESKQNVKVIHIDYWVEKAETGIHFDDCVLHTDNQIRRARCWFPCMDDNLQRCCYDMEFTVANNLVAVGTGTLLYQVMSKDDPSRRTYVYKLNIPVVARWISLAVGRFEILPDSHSGLLSHMCLPGNLSKLRNTVGFFHGAFSHYEDYLSAKFPFGSYAQVFISPEMAISSLSLGASMSIFSSHVLFDEKVIDQTIETRIKLAFALARQWFGVFITPEAASDEWLLDGLAGFLTDSFIKRFLGNNEARYRRYKANIAVCRADDSGATALSSSSSCKDLYGTQCIGFYGKIRSWKSVAILQMLEKQMGPESFRKILQVIVLRAQDATRSLRALSTKEFRHLANKVGNLERPFLKEFFPRWVGSCGCPLLKMGFTYNKRKNMVELAVLRGCTARPDTSVNVSTRNTESETREGDDGWPGMMSIRVHELDGMYDHPILPMAGESWQLLEIQCHSKLAAKRFQKPKKGFKPDGSDDNGDTLPTLEMRSNSDSPLLWLRADPEMEYLTEINFIQPVQMWINQLEKDKDVVAQAQAIATLGALPQLSFAVVNALNNFLSDTKAFWRVRIEAAFALAFAASEETDWAGLFHLIKFYKSRRFDPNIGLPKANDFHDFQEYFVLEAIPHAVATVRAADRKSPREAVEFVLQLLKYNDNNGNPYSDVFWLAALVQSVGELEFGQQGIAYLSSLLKRIDRLLQFDRLMPSHNGILTVSCIRSLTQIAVKLSEFIPLDSVTELIRPFRAGRTSWQIRVEACRALLDLEFQCKGLDAALILFITFLNEETSIRAQVKLGVHAMRLCQMREGSDSENDVKSETLVSLLRLLESPVSFNNVGLRHYIFCILQVLAGRAPTLYGVPRDETLRMGHAETCSELKNIFAALVKQSKPPEPSLAVVDFPQDTSSIPEASGGTNIIPAIHEKMSTVANLVPETSIIPDVQAEIDHHEENAALTGQLHDGLAAPEVSGGVFSKENEQVKPLMNLSQGNSTNIVETSREADRSARSASGEVLTMEKDEQIKQHINFPQDSTVLAEASKEVDVPRNSHDQSKPVVDILHETATMEASREPDTVSTSQERRKPIFRIKVKQSAASSRAEDPDRAPLNKSQDGHQDADRGASSSVSVDAPQRNFMESVSISNQNLEDVESCHDVGSRVTASIGSAKLVADADELGKELQCTADSSKVSLLVPSYDNMKDNNAGNKTRKFASLQDSISRRDINSGPLIIDNPHREKKDEKKDKEKKRKRDERKAKRDDPEYVERKRLKKEKKRKEKEMVKLLEDKEKGESSVELRDKNDKTESKAALLSRENRAAIEELVTKRSDIEIMSATADAEQKATSTDICQKDDHGAKISSLPLIPGETSGAKVVEKKVDTTVYPQGNTSHKLKIKIKGRTLQKS